MKKKGRSTIFFIISVLIIAGLAYLGSTGLNVGDYRIKSFTESIDKGLDLQGGVSVVEEIQGKVNSDAMGRTIELLNLRVNKLGVSETTVSRVGNNKIEIDVPGMYNKDEVINKIGKTGKLKFVGPDKKTVLTGSDVKKATAGTDPNTNQPIISLQLNSSGTKKFADATQKFLGQKISIYMDTDLLSDPTVDSVITGGNAQITGNKSIQEAQR